MGANQGTHTYRIPVQRRSTIPPPTHPQGLNLQSKRQIYLLQQVRLFGALVLVLAYLPSDVNLGATLRHGV
jgi:hypothetical protein